MLFRKSVLSRKINLNYLNNFKYKYHNNIMIRNLRNGCLVVVYIGTYDIFTCIYGSYLWYSIQLLS